MSSIIYTNMNIFMLWRLGLMQLNIFMYRVYYVGAH